MRKSLSLLSICAIVVTLAIIQQTNADIVIDVIETGGGIQATLSGDFDLKATQGFMGTSTARDGYLANLGAISFTYELNDYYGMTQSTWTPFGPGTVLGHWDTSSGDALTLFSNPVLGLPTHYVSGQSLSATAFKNGVSFASEGFTPGSYVTTLTNGNFSDSVTVNIGAAVPEPASLGVVSLIGLAVLIRRRRD